MSGFSMFELAFILASLAAMAAAIFSVKAREDFYAAILLGITGLSTAALLALLGYGFIAVFHSLVYVGATVMFVIFGVVLIGRTCGYEGKMVAPALIASTLLAVSLLALFLEQGLTGFRIVSLDLGKLQEILFVENPMALLFLGFSLAILIVAGIMLASGGEEVVTG
ncbi:MAG: NADH-quinone oxidoreductase subunit J [Infirmifilum sp.]